MGAGAMIRAQPGGQVRAETEEELEFSLLRQQHDFFVLHFMRQVPLPANSWKNPKA